MTKIPVHIFGNIVWKVKNGIVLKKNVTTMKTIFIVTNHKNAYPGNGFAMEPFNAQSKQKMKPLKCVNLKKHFQKEPQFSVQRV